MSLPNYLAKIKSSGIYRFVWDKSEVPPQEAEALRLVAGYSEKGPFNTPVYIDNVSDFITIFGNISKKLERKGVFFHRMAIQALAGGPILALNLKPFSVEKVQYLNFNGSDVLTLPTKNLNESVVSNLYDTNRFWYLDADQLPNKLDTKSYITITSTDVKDQSCSIVIRPYKPESYNLTIREWYANDAGGEEMPSYLEPIQDELLNKYFAEIYVFRGEFTENIVKEGGPFGNYLPIKDANGATIGQEWNGYFNSDLTLNTNYKNVYGETEDALQALADDSSSNFLGKYQGTLIPYFKDGLGNYISLDVLFNSDNASHKMLMKLDESKLEEADNNTELENYLYPGESSKYELVELSEASDSENLNTVSGITANDIKKAEITENNGQISIKVKNITLIADLNTEFAFVEGSGDNAKTHYYKLTEIYNDFSPIYVEGYTYETINKTDINQQLQNKIFKALDDKGIRTALTNRVDVEYHYIIDTFQSYIEPSCKAKLAQIAKEKDNAFAILNFPPLPEFVNYKTNDFKSTITGKFEMAKIAEKKNLFSLVTETNGASWCAYYTGLVFSDGTLKQNIPSAAVVSNNFMEKYGSRQPYYIVAGPNYGRITYDGLVGPDYNYGRTDLDVLEPLGVNAIIYVPRKGTYINSNQTAKQTPVSALSKIHVRELVIYLQDEIEAMLQNYQWELNTQVLRDTIKAKADTILENVKNNGGIYAYNNICDSTNNTPEVIDNEMIILDTAIEPARGAGKMVQQLTIHRTGGITSTTI